MTTKVDYKDVDGELISFASDWKKGGIKVDRETQTDIKITDFVFEDIDALTGVATDIVQDEVEEDDSGSTLLEYYCKHHKVKKDNELTWKTRIERGSITVDCEVSTNCDKIIDEMSFLEFVDYQADAGTQTETTNTDNVLPLFYEENEEKKQDSVHDKNLGVFLDKIFPLLEEELDSNVNSKAFDGYDTAGDSTTDEISLWKTLSVDLEKHKVVFPDWGKGKYYSGTITASYVNRNGERLYDVDYKDAVKLSGLREEHIRVLDDGEEARQKRLSRKGGKKSEKRPLRLQEGVRVHLRMEFKGGVAKFLPGRILKVMKNGNVDVELISGEVERSRSQEDLIQGIDVGQPVEARRPSVIQLQCTGCCWNSSGSSIAVSYGRTDVVGWCNFPGAVCVWTVFGRNFQQDTPDYVLDHTSCLTAIRYHPEMPAVLAAGSFNGEVVIWNLNTPEKPVGISPIDEFSHKEPVMDLEWVYDSQHKEYLLCSAGADGKILFWSLSNGLQCPIRGATLSKGKPSKRHYPSSHGATAIAFTGSSVTRRPEWVMVGQEGGALIRGQAQRLLSSPVLNYETLRTKFNLDESYQALKKEDKFAQEPHIGPVNSIDCSPFHKRLLLTAGQDGSVKLFHVLETQPLRQWDPSPPPGTTGITSTFGAITCVRFSKVRPLLFAAASEEGFVYLYDINQSSAPLAILEAPSSQQTTTTGRRVTTRNGFSSVAFNRKQRDLFAACDYAGKVYIWRLGWRLANKNPNEQAALDQLGDVQSKDSGE